MNRVLVVSDDSTRSQRRWSAIAFAVLCAIAVPVLLWAGREQWFYFDEWDLLVDRSATSLSDLLNPHNEHWSTIPILGYRLTFRLFGLNNYAAFQLPVILFHVMLAALLRVVMRRCGVRPWLATVVAVAFVFLGAGNQNITYGFQTGFTGALMLGTMHALLANHGGPFGRRDWVGLAVGLLGLTFAGIAVSMTFAVGVSVLLRRGIAMAAFHTAPLGAVFLVWYVAFGSSAADPPKATIREMADFLVVAARFAFSETGQYTVVAIALGALLVGGGAVAVATTEQWRRELAMPIGGVAGALSFVLIGAYGRAGWLGSAGAEQSRYVHVVMALLLPAIGVAAEALVRKSHLFAPAVALVVLGGLPSSMDQMAYREGNDRFSLGQPGVILGVANSPALASIDPSVHPIPLSTLFEAVGTTGVGERRITVGWLLEQRAAGRIPAAPNPSPEIQQVVDLLVGIAQATNLDGDRPALDDCSSLESPIDVSFGPGVVVEIRGQGVSAQAVSGGAQRVMFTVQGDLLIGTDAAIDVTMSSVGEEPAQLCS